MSASDAYVGDLASALSFTARIDGAVVDLTGATLARLYVQKPSGSRTSWTTGLAIVGAAAGTYSRTLSAVGAGDLDEAGEWTFQLQTTEGGVTLHYDSETKIVGERLG